jgi:hypothetical protein
MKRTATAAALALGMLLMNSRPACAATNAILSNLANPSIGFNALMLAQAAPDLSGPDGLQFQEAELSIVSVVDPMWTLWANLVFSETEVTPEEVYALSNALPQLALKLGRFKAAFGKHGQLHRHAWPFIQSPFILANTIGEEGLGGMGLEAAWMTPLPWYAELTLGAYRSQASAIDGSQPMDLGSASKDNTPTLVHWKNLWELDEGSTLEVGASGLQGQGADGRRHAAVGADLTLRWIPLRQSNQRGAILQGEYIQRLSYDDGGSSRECFGGYGSLQVRLDQDWWTGIRGEEATSATTDVLTDAAGLLQPGRLQRASANLTWTPSEFSALRLEGSVAKTDNDLGLPTMDRRLMLQANFTIGYHPAHAY